MPKAGRLIAGLGLALATAALARRRPAARAVLRISRVVADLDRAERFYHAGLGFQRVAAGPLHPRLCALLLPNASAQAATAEVRRMRLGADEIDLVRWTPPGPAYPLSRRSDDRWFQHLAIVTNDMDAAYARLLSAGPDPISTHGPQTLPGGIAAYKFRDPDGHPLELIHFPPGTGRPSWQQPAPSPTLGPNLGPNLGIDHSALCVSSTPRSLRFYRRLGFTLAGHSLNHGPAQAALDGLPAARLRVSGLRPAAPAGPGVELLGYLPPGRAALPPPVNAIATDWLTIDTGTGRPHLLRDPDGHCLLVTR